MSPKCISYQKLLICMIINIKRKDPRTAMLFEDHVLLAFPLETAYLIGLACLDLKDRYRVRMTCNSIDK
tara:strand:- start:290 stop:496 length:207 start_codon:yes stop_codon:yes gene_type:complete